jgi:hypothetical protein
MCIVTGHETSREAVAAGEPTSPPPTPSVTLVGRMVETWLPMALVAGLFIALARYIATPLGMADTYFHLRFGHEFLTDWTPTHPGFVTTFASREWLPTQWGSEIVMAKFEDWFGIAGVVWLGGTWMIGYALALFVATRRQAPAVAAATVTILALLASGSGLSPRPQVVSYLLMVVVVDAWLRTAADGKARWWLIPLTWGWALIHGMWILGVVTSFVAALGLVLDGRDRSRLRLFLVPLGMAVAAAATPVGPGLYGAVASVGARSRFMLEWGPPNFHHSYELVLAVLLVIVVAVRLRKGPNSWFLTLMVLVCAGWAVYSMRTVPIAAATAAPLAAQSLASLLPENGRSPRQDFRVAGILAAAVLALLPLFSFAYDHRAAEPAWVSQELAAMPSGTPLLSEWAWGSYLMWAYPELDVMMNGYADSFTDEELSDFSDLVALKPGWDAYLASTGVRTALLDPGLPLAYALEHQLGWYVVQRSDSVELLRAPAS